MKKKKFVLIGIGIILVASLWYFLRGENVTMEMICVPVEHGDFDVSVFTSGELEAKFSEDIQGPSRLRQIRINNAQISEMIPEGTVVKKGDWVATLDRSEISNRMLDRETELERLETSFIQLQLDTTMEMRNARNDLINLQFNHEEAKIALEQSQFEPPASIRQAEINLEKAERAYDQSTHNYELRNQQAAARMQEINAQITQEKRRYNELREVMEEFEVYAPRDGMVIYKRNWDGSRFGVGSSINAWDNTVATLPDFSVMMSRTYVNEIDISKVRMNQPVEVSVDAFPDRRYSGYVTEVANVGEQRPNQDARVFEVKIQLNESDTIMRPAMTTKNTIITQVERDVMFIPIEGIHLNDSITFVYKVLNNRPVRQQVITGIRNDNQIIIREGLEREDRIYLTVPADAAAIRLITL